MDAKEIVKQGLQARKDVRAAEARADKLREDIAATRDAYFYDQMRWKNARRRWQQERSDLEDQVRSQRSLIRQLVIEREELHKREQQAQQRRLLISAVKAVVVFILLATAKDLSWIVSWLADSLLALTATYLFFTVVTLVHGKK